MTVKSNISKRVLLTKGLVQNALIQMLKEAKINKITILELCQVAGINRTTFYKYYGSQYDVFDEIVKEYLQQTSFTVLENLSDGKSGYECLRETLQYIKDHHEFAKLMLQQDHYSLLSNIKYLFPQFDDIIINCLPETLDINTKNAIATYVQHGSVSILKEWVLSDCKVSPEEEAQLILYIAGRSMSIQ
ncbi:TetR/AcrR family transcriptional regulator [Cellulosilyticum sp. ST5]|uniref:TetR/AcrR family transcriptional regulator n=1 Tax=Cellulosilyticum sp. ST5 TaxID=3055805 RepID=UPI0039779396